MPEFTPEQMGGTMRLGSRTSVFRENDESIIRKYCLQSLCNAHGAYL